MSECRACKAELPPGQFFCSRCGTQHEPTRHHGLERGSKIGVDGRFEVVALLGSGAFGSVYKVRDLLEENQLNRNRAKKKESLRALKIPQESIVADEAGKRRFWQEIEILRKLSHPNIATIRDTGLMEHELPFFTMDYCDGPTLLAEVRAHGALSLTSFLAIAKGVLEALAYLHERGILHRDLKPSNIILTGDAQTPTARVVDFGIAKILDRSEALVETEGRPRIGTPLYMAPEQVDGGEITERTDIYNAAATFYESLTGRRPFDATTSGELYAQIRNVRPRRLALLRPELPARIDRAIMRALEKDPKLRPTSARAFLEQLNDFKPTVRPGRLLAAVVILALATLAQSWMTHERADNVSLATGFHWHVDPGSYQNDVSASLATFSLAGDQARWSIRAKRAGLGSPTTEESWTVELKGPVDRQTVSLRDLWSAEPGHTDAEPPEGVYTFEFDEAVQTTPLTVTYDKTAPEVSIVHTEGGDPRVVEVEPGRPTYQMLSPVAKVQVSDASPPIIVTINGNKETRESSEIELDLRRTPNLRATIEVEDQCGNLARAILEAPPPRVTWLTPENDNAEVEDPRLAVEVEILYERPVSRAEVEVRPEGGGRFTTPLGGEPGVQNVSIDLMPGANTVTVRAMDEARGDFGRWESSRTITCGAGVLFGPRGPAGQTVFTSDPRVVLAALDGEPTLPSRHLLRIEGVFEGTRLLHPRSVTTADLPFELTLQDMAEFTESAPREGDYGFTCVLPPTGIQRETAVVLDQTRPSVKFVGMPQHDVIGASSTLDFANQALDVLVGDRNEPLVLCEGEAIALTKTGAAEWRGSLRLPADSSVARIEVQDPAKNRVSALVRFLPKPAIGAIRSPDIEELGWYLDGSGPWRWNGDLASVSLAGLVSHSPSESVAVGVQYGDRRIPASVHSAGTGQSRFDVTVDRDPRFDHFEIYAEYPARGPSDTWRASRTLRVSYLHDALAFSAATGKFESNEVVYRLPDGVVIDEVREDGENRVFVVTAVVGGMRRDERCEMVLAGPTPSGPGITAGVEAFLIDRFEVTAGRFDRFARGITDESGLRTPPISDNSERPAVGVSFDVARRFAEWANKRIPTEAEWMVAAYWNERNLRRFPWGESWDRNAVHRKTADRNVNPGLVGELPGDRSYSGAIGMGGGVQEWADGVAADGQRRPVMGYHTMFRIADEENPGRDLDRQLAEFDSSRAREFRPASQSDMRVGFRCLIQLIREVR